MQSGRLLGNGAIIDRASQNSYLIKTNTGYILKNSMGDLERIKK